MTNVVTFDEYVANAPELLQSVALNVNLMIDGPHKENIKVLVGKVNVEELKPGYYMRFIHLGGRDFHLYGFEVRSADDIWVHENISRENFKRHADILFKDQLNKFQSQGRVIFYPTPIRGEGLDIHIQLANHYAMHGWIKEAKPKSPTPIPRKEHTIKSSTALSSSENARSTVASEIVFEKNQLQVDGLLKRLDKQIKKDNSVFKEDARAVYQQLDAVFSKYKEKRLNQEKLKEDMLSIVVEALPRFEKAPTWGEFFLNMFKWIANLFLPKQSQYQFFRPESYHGFSVAKRDIELIEVEKDDPSPPH